MNKKSIFVILLCLLSYSVFAQEEVSSKYEPGKHIFEFAAKAGFSDLTYDAQLGHIYPGYNTGVEFNYIFRSHKHVGFRIGFDAESSQSRFQAKDYSDAFSINDPNGELMNVTYNIERLEEKHTQVYFSVPLQMGIYANCVNLFIGPKFAFPLAAWTRQELRNSEMSAIYPSTGTVVTDMPAISAGKIEKQFYAEDAGLKTNPNYLPKVWIMLAGDLSVDVKIDKHHCLGIGVYGDYALNRATMSKTDNLSLLYLVEGAKEGTLARDSESILKANFNGLPDNQGQPLVHHFGYFSAGLKISIKVWD